MRPVLALALLLPGLAAAEQRVERRVPAFSRCVGFGGGGRTYVVPMGSTSPALCQDLARRCANGGPIRSQQSAQPSRVDPPYTVCD